MKDKMFNFFEYVYVFIGKLFFCYYEFGMRGKFVFN